MSRSSAIPPPRSDQLRKVRRLLETPLRPWQRRRADWVPSGGSPRHPLTSWACLTAAGPWPSLTPPWSDSASARGA